MKSRLLFLFLLLSTTFSSANQDFTILKTYDNVILRIESSYHNQEFNKSKVIGTLCSNLLEKLNYKKRIIIDYFHLRDNRIQTNYFISYGKGKLEAYEWREEKLHDIVVDNCIILRIIDNKINYTDILKLLNYAVLNENFIKRHQNEIYFEKNYLKYYIQTIDTLIIASEINKECSDIAKAVLQEKVVLSDPAPINKISSNNIINYYYENSAFHFIMPRKSLYCDTFSLTLNNVYQIDTLHKSLMIFDTDTSFYVIGDRRKNLSDKHIIRNTRGHYRDFIIHDLDDNLVSIYFDRIIEPDEKKDKFCFSITQTLIYDTDKDKLYPDIRQNYLDKYDKDNTD